MYISQGGSAKEANFCKWAARLSSFVHSQCIGGERKWGEEE